MKSAIFGPPEPSFVKGGTHLSVHLVPVFERKLVVFDVAAGAGAGRWLPWDVLPWRGNPYTTASELADNWCEGRVRDLRPLDTISLDVDGGGWELALVFRAELLSPPPGDEHRTVVLLDRAPAEGIQRFSPVELERWVDETAGITGPRGSEARARLVF
ncbi:MAG: hypothetical protein ACE5EF_01550 [Dehalococcoidia bacterium]